MMTADTARVLIRELASGPFMVSLSLPPNVEIDEYGEYADGLLRLNLRKRSPVSALAA